MPRRLRIHVDDGFYHVTLRGNHREPIFRADGDRCLLNAIVERAIEKYGARIHAYCWMTNHLHFLVQVGTEPLGAVMRQIAGNYARAFQRKLETSGHLFERRYHARLVANDTYLLTLLRYVHLNPVQAGVARSAAEHRWSSHHAYAGARGERWLTTDFVFAAFAPERSRAISAYRRFMAEGDPEWTPDDDDAVDQGGSIAADWPVPLSSHRFIPAPARQSFASLVAEACERFRITERELRSESRDAPAVLARAWIGREAVALKIATLADAARRLGRDRSTLRYAMRRLPEPAPEPGPESARRTPVKSAG